MRNLSPQLKNHLSAEVTTIATCWKLTRKDNNKVFAFTDHDQALFVDEIKYDSIAGFTPTNVESNSNMAVDNLDLAGQFHDNKITEIDLLAGKYDFAEVEIFLVNYQSPNTGKIIQKYGILGEVTLNKNLFHAEVRGLTQFLSQTMCETYLPHCRTNLGDQRCKFNLHQENFTVQAIVTEVIDRQTFTSAKLMQQNDWFTYGYISWQTGKNIGLQMEVKSFINSRITLVLPMPFVINVGDEFTIVAGCDKSSKTCIEKFNNIINFRGESDLPGIDRLSSRL
ncbi:DUF2163 domain-containing protein [Rickettsia endosymbiont of Ceutorhynchus obstrictus]|uniref:DUF2163 domain-containing protein n=1 Tax=Rickettsia endosymbiont of Ceutorhynchus obstrictus TaxID=3066249 RepID=UPI003132996E